MIDSRMPQVACPCCGGRYEKFLPFGHRQRPNALCPGCRSLERHRMLWLFLQTRTPILREPLSVLHIAPEEALRRPLERLANGFYVSGDLSAPDAMVRMDLTDIPFEDASFDAILCSHVLEHVPDDARAMSELFRVLVPGGWAVIQSPMDPTLATTDEDPSVVSPEERERRFGFREHVRQYGRDYVARLERAGFRVRTIPYAREHGAEAARLFGLNAQEEIFFCEKPGERPAPGRATMPRERRLDPRSAMNLLLARLRRLDAPAEKADAVAAACARQPLVEKEIERLLLRAPEKAAVFDPTVRLLKVWLCHRRGLEAERDYYISAIPSAAERAALRARLGIAPGLPLERLVLLITVDCMRGDRLGCAGRAPAVAPALDAIAAGGAAFPRAYATAGQTAQSFPGLMLSNFFQNFGAGRTVPEHLTSLAEALSRAGFRTVGVNAANPHVSRFYGYDRGFDEYTDFIGDRHFLHEEDAFVDNSDRRLAEPSQEELMALFEDLRAHPDVAAALKELAGKEGLPLARLIAARRRFYPYDAADLVKAFIGSLRARPDAPRQFHWLHLMDLHENITVPFARTHGPGRTGEFSPVQQFLLNLCLGLPAGVQMLRQQPEKYRALYDSAVSYVDVNVEILRAFLEDAGLWPRTLLCLTADHGQELFEEGVFGHGYDRLRANLVHVPLVFGGGIARRLRDAQAAGEIPADRPVSTLDVAPTVLDLLGLPRPESFLGRSLLDPTPRRPYGQSFCGEADNMRREGGRRFTLRGFPAPVKECCRELVYCIEGDWQILHDVSAGRSEAVPIGPAARPDRPPDADALARETVEYFRSVYAPPEEAKAAVMSEAEEALVKGRLADLGYL